MQGAPLHDLTLKYDALAMLIRNLNFSEGLANGQKVILRETSPNSRVIKVQLLTLEKKNAFIPRIMFHGKVGRKCVTFQRVQFPLRVAYSITVNKSQGQTLSRIGLDLRSDVFAHGHLYVALSHAQTANPSCASFLHIFSTAFLTLQMLFSNLSLKPRQPLPLDPLYNLLLNHPSFNHHLLNLHVIHGVYTAKLVIDRVDFEHSPVTLGDPERHY